MHKKIYIIVLTVLFFAALVVAQLLFSKGNIFEQQQASKQIVEYQLKVDSLKNVIEGYKITIEKLKKDSLYKEEILRTRFGMNRKKEKVFQMVK